MGVVYVSLEIFANFFFRIRENKMLFYENFVKIGYYNYYM